MERLRVLVGVYVVRGPMGGLSWHYLQYAAALARLGHRVTVVEDSDDQAWCCYDPVRGTNDTDATFGLSYATAAYNRLGLGACWAYYDAHGGGWRGPAAADVLENIASADVFLNVSGATVMRPWLRDVPRRVFIDTDPAFTQVRNLTVESDRALAQEHSHFFTFGERFGAADCTIPDDGFPWVPTRQPVALDLWSVSRPPSVPRFTTVMRWDSYATREFAGIELAMKSRSMQDYLDLPQQTAATLEIALGGPGPDDDLRRRGWRVEDPFVTAPDPWAMSDYIANSTAEFTVAKHGYVSTRSGWFSERSANYLASGRPVITQETGFSSVLPVGSGVLSFASCEDAARCIDEVLTRPSEHGTAARHIAEEYFDGTRVLEELLTRVMGD